MILVTAEIVSTVISVTASFPRLTVGGGAGGTIDVYLDGVLNQSIVSANLDAEIVNISL